MVMQEQALRIELAKISVKTYTRGLVGGTGGNISVRLDDNAMLITPSGVSLADTTADNIVEVNLTTLEWTPNGSYIPSKEYRFHAEIFKARADVQAIVHCHPRYATAYAVNKQDIPYVTDAAFKQPETPHVSFAPSGSDELVQGVAMAARSNSEFKVMLLDEHGIVAVGKDLTQAYNHADLYEELAQIAFVANVIKTSQLV